jgi:hypothetical protein
MRAEPFEAQGKQAPPLQAVWKRRVVGSLEDLVRELGLLDAERDLVGDADAVAFKSHYFFWMICEDADVF